MKKRAVLKKILVLSVLFLTVILGVMISKQQQPLQAKSKIQTSNVVQTNDKNEVYFENNVFRGVGETISFTEAKRFVGGPNNGDTSSGATGLTETGVTVESPNSEYARDPQYVKSNPPFPYKLLDNKDDYLKPYGHSILLMYDYIVQPNLVRYIETVYIDAETGEELDGDPIEIKGWEEDQTFGGDGAYIIAYQYDQEAAPRFSFKYLFKDSKFPEIDGYELAPEFEDLEDLEDLMALYDELYDDADHLEIVDMTIANARPEAEALVYKFTDEDTKDDPGKLPIYYRKSFGPVNVKYVLVDSDDEEIEVLEEETLKWDGDDEYEIEIKEFDEVMYSYYEHDGDGWIDEDLDEGYLRGEFTDEEQDVTLYYRPIPDIPDFTLEFTLMSEKGEPLEDAEFILEVLRSVDSNVDGKEVWSAFKDSADGAGNYIVRDGSEQFTGYFLEGSEAEIYATNEDGKIIFDEDAVKRMTYWAEDEEQNDRAFRFRQISTVDGYKECPSYIEEETEERNSDDESLNGFVTQAIALTTEALEQPAYQGVTKINIGLTNKEEDDRNLLINPDFVRVEDGLFIPTWNSYFAGAYNGWTEHTNPMRIAPAQPIEYDDEYISFREDSFNDGIGAWAYTGAGLLGGPPSISNPDPNYKYNVGSAGINEEWMLDGQPSLSLYMNTYNIPNKPTNPTWSGLLLTFAQQVNVEPGATYRFGTHSESYDGIKRAAVIFPGKRIMPEGAWQDEVASGIISEYEGDASVTWLYTVPKDSEEDVITVALYSSAENDNQYAKNAKVTFDNTYLVKVEEGGGGGAGGGGIGGGGTGGGGTGGGSVITGEPEDVTVNYYVNGRLDGGDTLDADGKLGYPWYVYGPDRYDDDYQFEYAVKNGTRLNDLPVMGYFTKNRQTVNLFYKTKEPEKIKGYNIRAMNPINYGKHKVDSDEPENDYFTNKVYLYDGDEYVKSLTAGEDFDVDLDGWDSEYPGRRQFAVTFDATMELMNKPEYKGKWAQGKDETTSILQVEFTEDGYVSEDYNIRVDDPIVYGDMEVGSEYDDIDEDKLEEILEGKVHLYKGDTFVTDLELDEDFTVVNIMGWDSSEEGKKLFPITFETTEDLNEEYEGLVYNSIFTSNLEVNFTEDKYNVQVENPIIHDDLPIGSLKPNPSYFSGKLSLYDGNEFLRYLEPGTDFDVDINNWNSSTRGSKQFGLTFTPTESLQEVYGPDLEIPKSILKVKFVDYNIRADNPIDYGEMGINNEAPADSYFTNKVYLYDGDDQVQPLNAGTDFTVNIKDWDSSKAGKKDFDVTFTATNSLIAEKIGLENHKATTSKLEVSFVKAILLSADAVQQYAWITDKQLEVNKDWKNWIDNIQINDEGAISTINKDDPNLKSVTIIEKEDKPGSGNFVDATEVNMDAVGTTIYKVEITYEYKEDDYTSIITTVVEVPIRIETFELQASSAGDQYLVLGSNPNEVNIKDWVKDVQLKGTLKPDADPTIILPKDFVGGEYKVELIEPMIIDTKHEGGPFPYKLKVSATYQDQAVEPQKFETFVDVDVYIFDIQLVAKPVAKYAWTTDEQLEADASWLTGVEMQDQGESIPVDKNDLKKIEIIEKEDSPGSGIFVPFGPTDKVNMDAVGTTIYKVEVTYNYKDVDYTTTVEVPVTIKKLTLEADSVGTQYVKVGTATPDNFKEWVKNVRLEGKLTAESTPEIIILEESQYTVTLDDTTPIDTSKENELFCKLNVEGKYQGDSEEEQTFTTTVEVPVIIYDGVKLMADAVPQYAWTTDEQLTANKDWVKDVKIDDDGTEIKDLDLDQLGVEITAKEETPGSGNFVEATEVDMLQEDTTIYRVKVTYDYKDKERYTYVDVPVTIKKLALTAKLTKDTQYLLVNSATDEVNFEDWVKDVQLEGTLDGSEKVIPWGDSEDFSEYTVTLIEPMIFDTSTAGNFTYKLKIDGKYKGQDFTTIVEVPVVIVDVVFTAAPVEQVAWITEDQLEANSNWVKDVVVVDNKDGEPHTIAPDDYTVTLTHMKDDSGNFVPVDKVDMLKIGTTDYRVTVTTTYEEQPISINVDVPVTIKEPELRANSAETQCLPLNSEQPTEDKLKEWVENVMLFGEDPSYDLLLKAEDYKVTVINPNPIPTNEVGAFISTVQVEYVYEYDGKNHPFTTTVDVPVVIYEDMKLTADGVEQYAWTTDEPLTANSKWLENVKIGDTEILIEDMTEENPKFVIVSKEETPGSGNFVPADKVDMLVEGTTIYRVIVQYQYNEKDYYTFVDVPVTIKRPELKAESKGTQYLLLDSEQPELKGWLKIPVLLGGELKPDEQPVYSPIAPTSVTLQDVESVDTNTLGGPIDYTLKVEYVHEATGQVFETTVVVPVIIVKDRMELIVPPTLEFEDGVAGDFEDQLLKRQDPDWSVTVNDYRDGLVEDWEVSVKLTGDFKANIDGKERTIKDILMYKADESSKPEFLDETSYKLFTGNGPGSTTKKWEPEAGFLIYVDRFKSVWGIAAGDYEAKMQFTLTWAP